MNNDTITTTDVIAKIVARSLLIVDNQNRLAAKIRLTGDCDLPIKLTLCERRETINYPTGPATFITRWFDHGNSLKDLQDVQSAIADAVRAKLVDQVAAGEFEVVKGEEGYDVSRLAEVLRGAFIEAHVSDLVQDRVPFVDVKIYANYKTNTVRLDDRVLVYEDNVEGSVWVAYEGSEAERLAL